MGNLIPSSEVIAPFRRTTSSPLELNYIFKSYERLEIWASNNKQILHNGLLKIVVEDDCIVFYAIRILDEERNYSIDKLISSKDIENILNLIKICDTNLEDFKNEISKMFKDLNDDIQAIWGVPDESVLPENMNSIAKIISAFSAFVKFINSLEIKDTDRAISGATDDNVIKYLSGLKYNSITVINNVLDKFFNKDDKDASTISTWFELQKFLSGFKDTDVLIDFINERIGDLISFENSDTIDFERIELKKGTTVKSHLRLDPDNRNMIIKRRDGIYFNVELKHENNSINFYVNDNLKTSINMSELAMKVKDVYYEQATETLVIIITTVNGDSVLRIPMSIVIREWEISNDENSPVVLNLDAAVGQGKDKLSATLKVSTVKNNTFQIFNDGVYVKMPVSTDVEYKDSNVGHTLDKLSEKCEHNTTTIDSLNEQILELINTVTAMDNKFTNSIETLRRDINDSMNAMETRFNETINNMKIEFSETINNMKSEFDDAIDNTKIEFNKALTTTKDELNQSIESVRNDFEKAITDTNNKFDESISVINENINTINSDIEAIKKDIEDKHQWINVH